jgi:hypothetical protein
VIDLYGDRHKEQIIRVILGEAMDHIAGAIDCLDKIAESFSGEYLAVNYLAVYGDFYEAGVHTSKAYFKVGGPESVNMAEIFEPALGAINTGLLYFQGCFEEWKCARPDGKTCPPGLTPHAVMAIGLEIERGKGLLAQALDIVQDKVFGLADALREVETIRLITAE